MYICIYKYVYTYICIYIYILWDRTGSLSSAISKDPKDPEDTDSKQLWPWRLPRCHVRPRRPGFFFQNVPMENGKNDQSMQITIANMRKHP